MELTDKTRSMTALQWAKLCGRQSCLKSLRKYKTQYKKLSHDKSVSKAPSDHHTTTNPLIKIRDSIRGSHHSKHSSHDYSGIESIVACASTPTIPILRLAGVGGTPLQHTMVDIPVRIPSLDSNHRSTSSKTSRCRRSSSPQPTPKIEITSDTGESITPSKTTYSASNRKLVK